MRPLRVLIVEDEAAIAMLVEDAVEQSGHIVAQTASNIKDAMGAAGRGEFDVALLDVNLHGQKAHALPVMLSASRKPFAFLTGYGQSGILAKFSDAPVVTKPFRAKDVADVLGLLSARLSKGG